jgi:hypothetical protein
MSPITIAYNNLGTQGNAYTSPFRGKIDHTAQIPCDLSFLTSREVDSDGVLKPGVPLKANGALVGGPAATQAYRGTGNGTLTGLAAAAGAADDVYQLTLITAAANGGTFRVVSNKRGVLANAVVATPFVDAEIGGFTINDGATDFIVGDEFTIVVASPAVYGVTIEPLQLATGNTQQNLDDAGTPWIGVATIAQVNKNVIEDNLGAALTVAEISGFTEPGCLVKLLS